MKSQTIALIAAIAIVTVGALFFMLFSKKNSATTKNESNTENVIPESKKMTPTETPLADDGHAHEH